MTKLDQIRAAESRLLLSTYDRSPVLFTGGEGVYITDEQGSKYLDLLSGIGVNALGYNHPVIVDAIAEQSKKLIHTSNLYYHEGQAELALRLTERTGLDRAFFANTGTEAWEGALKLARAHAGLLRERRQEDRDEVSGARSELSRAHVRRDVDDLQGQVPRAVWAGGAGRGVCEVQRRGRSAREVFERGVRDSAWKQSRARAAFVR